MKYKVFVHELEWYNRVYEIEADSEEEAKEEIEDGNGDVISEDYDCCRTPWLWLHKCHRFQP